MSKVVAVANQKGGVGKTTTTVNLASCVAEKGKRVLLVDMDPQGNATSGVGIDHGQVEKSIYDVLLDDLPVQEAVLPTCVKNLYVLPSNIQLAGAEIELVSAMAREHILKHQLELVQPLYDYIFIDCPPSLGLLTLNALTASDSVLVPIQCEYYALEGLNQVLKTVNLVKKKLNPSLEMEGVVFTMYDARTNLSLEVVESVKNNLNQNIYKTIIPRNVRLAEAPSHGMPINLYDSRSAGAESYRLLAAEVISRGEDI